jgi:SAM-dependent methyltransferase
MKQDRPEAPTTAELYDRVWRRGVYSGFSRATSGEAATPFLDAFVAAVKARGVTSARVLELGAGSCDHALRCAREGFQVTAVEYSEIAVTSARERLLHLAEGRLEIVRADLFAFTRGLAQSSLAGVYSNAVFHFLSAEERREQYRLLHDALADGGVLAISFKAEGDALESRGVLVERAPAGPVVEGDDGIRRLFVTDTDVLGEELRDASLSVIDVVRWSVSDYNVVSERGEFVGFLASR